MNARRLFLVNILIILVIIIAGFIGYYFYNQSTLYLKTNDAAVSGQQIVIAPPVNGKLENWDGTLGTSFHAGDTVGDVQVQAGNSTKDIAITMPSDGTIVLNNAMNNELIAPGEVLAYAYNLNNLWITANIKETQINNVKVGQNVDVYVDAYPGTKITGTVEKIGLATANTFSLLPTQSTNADFTKVTQVIPVRIKLQGYEGIGLAPGMSANVRIHK